MTREQSSPGRQRKFICVVNGRSGTAGQSAAAIIEAAFARHGIIPQIMETGDGRTITDLVTQAAQDDCDTVIAAGGDGTVSALASALVGSPKSLGVIPMGTLNHFAKDMGIPVVAEAAVNCILAGLTKLADVGEVNSRIFINNSSLGLNPAVVDRREALRKSGIGKWPALAWASLSMFMQLRRLHLELQPAEGTALKRVTPLLFIGNNTYDTAWPDVGTRRSIDQGHLWVMLSMSSTRLALLASAISILRGREKASDVIAFDVSKLVVSSRHRQLTVAADGEIFRLQTPLTYRILPKALRVIVPDGVAKDAG